MVVEAVTHALQWIASRGSSQNTHAIILMDSVSLLQCKVKWKAHTAMCQWLTFTSESSCVYTALDMPERREMTENCKQPSQVACMSKDLRYWGAWDITCGHRAKDITSSIAWRREAWKEEALDDLPWRDKRGPSSVRWTLALFQRKRWGNLWEMGWSAYGLFQAQRHDLELNWMFAYHI